MKIFIHCKACSLNGMEYACYDFAQFVFSYMKNEKMELLSITIYQTVHVIHHLLSCCCRGVNLINMK